MKASGLRARWLATLSPKDEAQNSFTRTRHKELVVMTAKPSFAIIGAGIGGLALAAFLSRQGARVKLYEQAKQFWLERSRH